MSPLEENSKGDSEHHQGDNTANEQEHFAFQAKFYCTAVRHYFSPENFKIARTGS